MKVSRQALAVAAFGLTGVSGAWAVQETTANESETVLLSADTVTRDDENSPVTAEGNVRAFFGEQTLVADRLTYDPTTDVVIAEGHVSIFDGDGQSYFADSVELTGDLKDGVAANFSALIGKQTRLAGSSVVRRSSGNNDLNNAVFTGCSVCREDGSKKTPTWAVKALRVTQDTEDETIRFRNATIEVLGVPVLYTPYFEFPDPSAKRKSGFLTPSIGNSTRAGFEAEIPYYWAISDYQDFTFSPRVMTELGTLVKGEYRVQRHNGGAVVQAGIIDPLSGYSVRNGRPTENPDDWPTGPRWHVFSAGYREFRDHWRGEYDVNLVSDKGYLRTYDIQPQGELRETIDIVQPDRLENRLSFSRRTNNSFTDISTFMFQSLRFNEDNDYFADAMPRIRHEQRMPVPVIGGDVQVEGNLLYLNRPEGLDTMRAVAKAGYEKRYTTQNGHRLRGFAEMRADIYRYSDVSQGIEACNVEDRDYDVCRLNLPREGEDDTFETTRLLPTAGVEWTYPLAKFTEKATFIIEPKVQAVFSPDRDYTDDIINEDSGFFQFDTITLFDPSKSSGLDLWEDGQRLNVGVTASALYTNGLEVSGTIGQQFRAEDSTTFDDDVGLGERSSDLVGDVSVKVGNRFQLDNKIRLDKADGTLRRNETNARTRIGPVSGALTYLRVESPEFSAEGRRDEFMSAALSYQLTDKWTVGGNWRENLESGTTVNQSLLLQYRDDCTIFSLAYRFDNTTGDGFNENRSLTFNVDILGF
ncbi:LPS-assembly protein LptD [Parvularcula sp. LCG005]|uniref:LPS-assembly protein LptD n=1 Tax=Parvularcula sp. LCG005 TaxID=3078805 RepID=UPI002941ED0C|nr:LPS assembly protein LptD [Parvularcula sp. LCG005]WOI52294.1 LPS assembly protein LptD [Parvularcula sp. LCG005]